MIFKKDMIILVLHNFFFLIFCCRDNEAFLIKIVQKLCKFMILHKSLIQK